jgi:Leucine-rich repeat (LRR) protein
MNSQALASRMVINDYNKTANTELVSQNETQGSINQRFGYIEVPFEISYKLVDKKIGVEIISGLSTLFLNNNQVSIVSSGLTTILGEANNLNKIHFSTNIGLGVKYNFWKSFEANIEPTFKYQINTFSNDSGGFKPYFVGLYSGISYNF